MTTALRRPTPVEPAVFGSVQSQTYASAAGGRFQVEHPLTKALVGALAAVYPNALPLAAALDRARRQVEAGGGGRHGEETDACLGEVFSLFASQALRLTARDAEWPTGISDRPCASALARAQAAAGRACGDGTPPQLGPTPSRLLTLLDGSAIAPPCRRVVQTVAAEPALAGRPGQEGDRAGGGGRR
jgi:hypothetical protein